MRALPLLAIVAAVFLIQIADNPEMLTNQAIVGNTLSSAEESRYIDMPTALGAVIVFFFYWFKFAEWAGNGVAPPGYHPRPVRHFTTWLRYIGWNSFYGLLMTGSYALIVFFPELLYQFLVPYTTTPGNIGSPTAKAIESILEFLSTGGDFAAGTPINPAQIAPYAVMLTTVVWAGMRPFAEFEKRFRFCLQEHAAIPRQAKLLIENFFEDEGNFEPDPEVMDKVRKHLNGHPLDPDDFRDRGGEIWFHYARTAYLNYLLQKYNRTPVFARLAERYVNEFNDLELKMQSLNKLVLERIDSIQSLIPQNGENGKENDDSTPFTLKKAEKALEKHLERTSFAQQKIFKDQESRLREEINSTCQDVVQLIVCGVLAVGRSSAQRRDLMEAFGIKQGRGASQLDSITITWIAAGTLIVTFLCSVIYFYSVQHLDIEKSEIIKKIPQSVDNALYWSVLACLMHLLAVGSGFFLQRTLETSRKRLHIGKRRKLSTRSQFAEAIWSGCVGFSVNVYFLGGLAAFSGDFTSLVQLWWWALIPGVTAFFAALYTQQVDQADVEWKQEGERQPSQRNNRQHDSRKVMFWMQGIATGTIAALVFLVSNEQFIRADATPSLSADEISAVLSFGVYITITTTLIGLTLAKFLHIWITAEKYAGRHERRHGKRRWHFFMRGKWQTDTGEQAIRAVSTSPSGAAIETTSPLVLASTGEIKLGRSKPRPAKVVGIDDGRSSRCYIQYLDLVA